jgi:hypothetical protein
MIIKFESINAKKVSVEIDIVCDGEFIVESIVIDGKLYEGRNLTQSRQHIIIEYIDNNTKGLIYYQQSYEAELKEYWELSEND